MERLKVHKRTWESLNISQSTVQCIIQRCKELSSYNNRLDKESITIFSELYIALECKWHKSKNVSQREKEANHKSFWSLSHIYLEIVKCEGDVVYADEMFQSHLVFSCFLRNRGKLSALAWKYAGDFWHTDACALNHPGFTLSLLCSAVHFAGGVQPFVFSTWSSAPLRTPEVLREACVRSEKYHNNVSDKEDERCHIKYCNSQLPKLIFLPSITLPLHCLDWRFNCDICERSWLNILQN